MARCFPIHVFRRLGFATPVAKSIVAAIDHHKPSGLEAEDVAAAIDRWGDGLRMRYQRQLNVKLANIQPVLPFIESPLSIGN